MPNFLDTLLGRQVIPNQPNPEPPGFNNMRAAMMQRYFQQMANPYGLSGQGPAPQVGRQQPYSPYSNTQGGPGGGGMGAGGMGGGNPMLQMLMQYFQQQQQNPGGQGQPGGGGSSGTGVGNGVPMGGGNTPPRPMPQPPQPRFRPPDQSIGQLGNNNPGNPQVGPPPPGGGGMQIAQPNPSVDIKPNLGGGGDAGIGGNPSPANDPFTNNQYDGVKYGGMGFSPVHTPHRPGGKSFSAPGSALGSLGRQLSGAAGSDRMGQLSANRTSRGMPQVYDGQPMGIPVESYDGKKAVSSHIKDHGALLKKILPLLLMRGAGGGGAPGGAPPPQMGGPGGGGGMPPPMPAPPPQRGF